MAEYIWIDGSQPTSALRSKTMVLSSKPEIWGFDGSSTNQAEGRNSDCVLQPVHIVPDPIRGGDNKLVMCEVLTPELKPHPSNTRSACARAATRYEEFDMWFGLEQEYTLYGGTHPLGWPTNGFPAPQGGYYCGVGADEVFGRNLVNAHMEACISAGLSISGINAEVMPAQWEFQIGPLNAPQIADEVWLGRWLLYRLGEDFALKGNAQAISARLDPKPVAGDWNGAGCHTNFSTKQMRQVRNSRYPGTTARDACMTAVEALREKHELHVRNYGHGIEQRLTGSHETASYTTFSAGVSDRGASIRIPWQVEKNGAGYLEDRRPNANCDPYVVTRLIIETVCGKAAEAAESGAAEVI